MVTSIPDVEVDFSECIDTLLCRFEPFRLGDFETNLIELFNHPVQESNELIDQEIFLESYEKKLDTLTLTWDYKKSQIQAMKKSCLEINKESEQLSQAIEKASELEECQNELDSLHLEMKELETKLELLESDSQALKLNNQGQSDLIRSIESDDAQRLSRINTSMLLPIKIVECLAGLRAIESSAGYDTSEKAMVDVERPLSRFEVMFFDLPDDCLAFEDTYKPINSQIKLSNEILERYRAVHKKRKLQGKTASAAGTGLIVKNLSDFKVVFENFQTILCAYLTKQEIEKAGRRFGLDWIEGSPVITILVDSKATKMATIVLPKYYPLCGTSMIKLTSMTGYDNSAIKNFRIQKNFGSLVEWIERFIDLYNTNQLE